jgi:hypothetical protein
MNIPQILWNLEKYKGCIWLHSGDSNDYTTLNWSEENSVAKPSLEQLQQDWDNEVSAIIALKEVQQQRAKTYPSIADQLDMLYHDIKAGTLDSGAWIQAIEAVKTEYPKP